MGRVVINQAFVNSLGSYKPVDRDLERRAHRVASMARGRGPIKTGAYVSSIGVERLRRHGYRVTASDRKSWWIERGTKPHVIRPKVKQALWWPGAPHPMAKVNHPGTRPTHNMAEALELASRGVSHVR
ncbi:hypothetical protein GCM10023224_05090 [Streptomonospora halophila]|uniref:HK97 gp10 family phage protein n=1 Tax=Streptomonospora halophila TaxID=427369 RepID=A0ABP9G5U6_9ACTN